MFRDTAGFVASALLGALIAWLPGSIIHLLARTIPDAPPPLFSALLPFATCGGWLLVRRRSNRRWLHVALPFSILVGIWLLAPVATTISFGFSEGETRSDVLRAVLKDGGVAGWIWFGFSASTYEGSLLGLLSVTVGLPVLAALELVKDPTRSTARSVPSAN